MSSLDRRSSVRPRGARALLRLGFFTSGVAIVLLSTVVSHAAPKRSFLVPVDSSLDLKPLKSSGQSSGQSSEQASTSSVTHKALKFNQRFIAAIDRARANDNKSALSSLNALLQESSISADQRDRVYLALGRIHYQSGNDGKAVEAYKQVRKGSPSWLESLEERSWAFMRMGQPQSALASLKTVLTPLFQDRVSSEPYFLAALAQLRVCDFQSVFKTMDLFKTRFRTRVRAWEAATDPASKRLLRETSDTIQKLNLVEAEAIQRLYLDESGKRAGGAPPKIAKESNQLSFPTDSEMDSKEVWLDEVDDYRVTVKGCPVNDGTASLSRVKKEGRI